MASDMTMDNLRDTNNLLVDDQHWIVPLFEWKGFWFSRKILKAAMAMEEQFKALPSDILLASFPKTGTTWLKALVVAIHNRSRDIQDVGDDDPLQDRNPHDLVPILELQCYGDDAFEDINKAPSPRILQTHMPYSCLSKQVKSSGSRVIYISRNPADTFVSSWHFYNELIGSNMSFEDDFEAFCKGHQFYGPYFNHVLEYWQMKDSENVLFLTYEELKEDPNKHVKRLADFLGRSLSFDEIEKVVRDCSFDRLAASPANERSHFEGFKNSSFYRKGIVGDWKNFLTPEMSKRLVDVASQCWSGTGLESLLTYDA